MMENGCMYVFVYVDYYIYLHVQIKPSQDRIRQRQLERSQERLKIAKENFNRTYSFKPDLSPFVQTIKENEKKAETQKGKESDEVGGGNVRLKIVGTLQEHIVQSQHEKSSFIERERRKKFEKRHICETFIF
jgi:hypothetical protein